MGTRGGETRDMGNTGLTIIGLGVYLKGMIVVWSLVKLCDTANGFAKSKTAPSAEPFSVCALKLSKAAILK